MKTESASRDLEWYRRRYESIKKCRTIYRNRWERTIHELLEEREKVKKLESGYLNLINDQLNDLSRKIENTASKIEKYGSEDSFMGSGLNPDKPIDQMTDGEINRLIEQKRKIHDQKGGH